MSQIQIKHLGAIGIISGILLLTGCVDNQVPYYYSDAGVNDVIGVYDTPIYIDRPYYHHRNKYYYGGQHHHDGSYDYKGTTLQGGEYHDGQNGGSNNYQGNTLQSGQYNGGSNNYQGNTLQDGQHSIRNH
ncbi:MAG: hypothetical protein PHE73_06905 [Sulfurovaceae bacterium]|nr:hypothetical protein [Sulfurovaceae bacterium]